MIYFHPGVVSKVEDLPRNLKYEAVIYTDGSADNIRGGRVAFVASIKLTVDGEHYLTSYVFDTAESGKSPYAELQAIILALDSIPLTASHFMDIRLYSDSEWAIRCITGEYTRRKLLEEWEVFEDLSEQYPDIRYNHCRGHVGIPENEICDSLADILRKTGALTTNQIEKTIYAFQNRS